MAAANPHIPSPCYVLEEDRLRHNLEILREVQEKAGITILLAFKGFAMWHTFPLIKEYLPGAVASSLHEARLCNEEMGVLTHTYAPAYLAHEFNQVMELSSHISFNSINQYNTYRSQIEDFGGHHISSGLRVNPENSDVETALYNPASPESRLGLTADHLRDGLPDGIEGLHFHVLCESSAESLQEVLEAFEHKFGHLLHSVRWVNMGGGHLITDATYNRSLLVDLLVNFRKKYNVDIYLEPGGAIAWQAGYLLSTVQDVIENGGVKTAILDVSFTCHMPDCLEMPYRPVVRNARSEPYPDGRACRLGGLSCLAGDFLEAYYFENDLKAGDQVIFEDMMHYTMVKTTLFNGVPHPSIGMIHSDGSFELIKQIGYEAYKDRLS